ncbi:MAG TPA: type IV toxin-antitoxin system AbiEi family antitoxin [Longimicrobiales bacterium]|nr:type IV toxin-antitoxin system AbiEi family antitoxin [Longimicrobiales bacterium]
MRASEYIDQLAGQGRHHFTTEMAQAALGGTASATRGQIQRLRKAGAVASPARSFHVIVPPEYRRLGCLPAEHFIHPLMEMWAEPYYVGLLSAAERHGAAHQRPQALQVMVRRNRRPVACGQVRIDFIARHDLEGMPVQLVSTPRGYVRYATAEVTGLEMVGYPNHSGGLSNVATVLGELAEAMSAHVLVEVAERSPISWAQRLGYLLETVGRDPLAAALLPLVQGRAHSDTPLRRAKGVAGGRRNSRWRLIINTDVEPDL